MRKDFERDTQTEIGEDVRRILDEERRAQAYGSSGYTSGPRMNSERDPYTASPYGSSGYTSDPGMNPEGDPYTASPYGAAPGMGQGQPENPGQSENEDPLRRPLSRAEARELKARRRAAEKEAKDREKRMNAAQKAALKESRRAERREKAPYVFISWFFVLIFLSLIGYLVYFNLYRRDAVMDSPYNRRSDIQVRYTVRGSIVSSEGEVLAETEVDEEGNEHRIYPYGSVFAHAVGYSTNGRTGLESAANYELLTSHINIIDRMINELQEKKSRGDTVVTTLSARLQQVAWDAIGDRQGAVVAIDPKTGAVRAIVSRPDFDPNTIARDWNDIISGEGNSQLVNRATQGLYAPGSTFKIVTALAYYQEHGSMEGFDYTCTGELTVGSHTVHCVEGTAHGEEDLVKAFARSCNCAFSTIGLDLGAEKLSETAKQLLFGRELPCELSYNRSRFPLTEGDGSAAVMQTAFGQGNTVVTPYHMALIASAIANGGEVMAPQLVWKVESADGNDVYENDPKSWGRIMSEDEASMLTYLMEHVITEGTGTGLAGLDYSVAGKTGSAEFTLRDGSVGTHSWFVGFSNVEEPDLAVAVLIENGGSGSAAALPVAKAVFDAYQEIHNS